MTLKALPIGKTATVTVVGGEGELRQHFLDMGIIPWGTVTMVKYAPMGDPVEVRVHSYELTLRLADFHRIDHRIYGKGKCGQHIDNTVWKYTGTSNCTDSADCSCIVGILPAVYTLCGSNRFCKERTGSKVGLWSCGQSMCYCMDYGIAGTFGWQLVYLEISY